MSGTLDLTAKAEPEEATEPLATAAAKAPAPDAHPGEASVEIAAFVCDDAAKEAVSGALSDQGISGSVNTGGIAAATEYLKNAASPRLMIVDLSESSNPMEDIDALAEVCDPGTSVISIGSANDVSLFRDLLAAGVADYLIKPISSDAISAAINNASHHHQRADAAPDLHKPGRLIAFIGARGGVGCSSVAMNCASIIAQVQGRRVVLVDLDLQFGTTALALDVEAGRGLREALENPARIDSLFVSSAAVSVGQNLFVLAAEEPLDGPLMFDSEALELLLAELRHSFDCIILDVPRTTAVAQWHMLATSDSICIVTDLSLPGMRDTIRLTGIAKSAAPETNLVVVANRAGADKKGEIPSREFEKSGEVKIDFVIPDDPKAYALSSNNGKPLLTVAKSSKAVKALQLMSHDLTGGNKKEAKRAPAWRRLLKK